MSLLFSGNKLSPHSAIAYCFATWGDEHSTRENCPSNSSWRWWLHFHVLRTCGLQRKRTFSLWRNPRVGNFWIFQSLEGQGGWTGGQRDISTRTNFSSSSPETLPALPKQQDLLQHKTLKYGHFSLSSSSSISLGSLFTSSGIQKFFKGFPSFPDPCSW
jgi:hypothetical protein